MIIAEINDQFSTARVEHQNNTSASWITIPISYPLYEYTIPAARSRKRSEKLSHYNCRPDPQRRHQQLVIVEIQNAVTKNLVDKKRPWHSHRIVLRRSEDLVWTGVITGKCKTLHPGKIVAGFLLGSRRLYDWAHENPLVEIHPTEYVNDPFIIAQNSKMTAINSAIEIDLTGQVCADSIGNKLYSGVGGQVDFIYGASLTHGCLPSKALPSNHLLRWAPCICNHADPKVGAGLVTACSLCIKFYEYGAVDLYGKSIRKRAEALISIAHPMFRDELRAEAKKLNYL